MRMWMCEQSMKELREALEGPLQAANFGEKNGGSPDIPPESSTNSSCGQALRSARCCALCCKSDTGHFSCNCCSNSISQILQYPFHTWGNRLWSLLQGYQISACLKLKSKHSLSDSETCSERKKKLQQRLRCQSSQNRRKEQKAQCDTDKRTQIKQGSWVLWGTATGYHVSDKEIHYYSQTGCFQGLLASGSDGKESACNVGDRGSIPGSERSPGEGTGNPLAWRIPGTEEPGGLESKGVTKSRTRLSK